MALGDTAGSDAGVVHPSCSAAGRSRWQAAKTTTASNNKTTKANRRVLRFIGFSWPDMAKLIASILPHLATSVKHKKAVFTAFCKNQASRATAVDQPWL
jgi:hypothetical protein